MKRKVENTIQILVILFLVYSCGKIDQKEEVVLSSENLEAKVEVQEYINYNIPLNELIEAGGIEQNNVSIYIDKSDFVLSVKNRNEIVKEYPVVLGTNPVDDKKMQGDRCTPEGTFHIISKYPHASWRKFIWIDYPNEESWKKFKEAKANGEIPKDAKIGGEVGIHGTPESCDYLIDDQVNWTFGCISLKRKDIDDLYPFITKQTDIVIVR